MQLNFNGLWELLQMLTMLVVGVESLEKVILI